MDQKVAIDLAPAQTAVRGDSWPSIVDFSSGFLLDGKLASANQRRRHDAVLAATLDLLREVGFEKTKINDVALRSGVALATVYRYFGSRDCLIYEATYRWGVEVMAALRGDFDHPNLAVRVLRLIGLPMKEFAKEQELAKAWAHANISNDPEVTKRMRARRADFTRIVKAVAYGARAELVDDLTLIIEQMTFAGWVRWVQNQQSYEEIAQTTERAALLALAAHGALQIPAR